MMNNLKCDSCGCFLNPEQWKECDKCQDKDSYQRRKHYGEVVKYESGAQDD